MTRHVVIADDRRVNLRILGGAAAALHDVMVHPFLQSADALAWSRDNVVDCYVLDYHMPAPNGLEMISRIRAVDPAVPIVLATAEEEREIVYAAFERGANDFIRKPFDVREFQARLTTMLDLREAQQRAAMRIDILESSLRDSEERSREHADRLEALWKVLRQSLSGPERWAAALVTAGRSIRRDQPFDGLLGRLVDDATTLETVACTPGLSGVPRRLAIAGTPIAALLDDGGSSRSWDEVRTPALAGARAAVAVVFAAARATYVLCFVANEPPTKPFSAQDHSYVEIVASTIAHDLEQAWQSERLRHEQSHDVLTGVLNRSRFRSEARIASARLGRFGVLVFDVVDFSEVNMRRGHMIGDALLVEVAVALRARAIGGEFVGRVGGDVFAVFVPEPGSRAELDERSATFLGAFGQPFSTGDREGRDVVALRARSGVAFAPDDGATFEHVFIAAEQIVATAKERERTALTR